MTTEEKLQHFLDFCMEDARARSAKMLDEYTDALEQSFTEHQADAKRRAEQQVRLESEKLEREMNKKLSIEQINIKRALGQKQDSLKEKLFVELRDMLAHYLETPEYRNLLEQQVKHAQEFAGNDELIIYIDPADETALNRLALHTNAEIRVSEYSFTGGIRAVIPSRHILIDNSFQTRLAEEKHEFHFELNAGSETGGRAND